MKMLIHEQDIKGIVNRIHLSEPVIHADNEAAGRSGHLGHALTELAPGKVLAFSANTSAKFAKGHAAFGWMEYRISEDYGETFGKPQKLPFSWNTLLDGINTVGVEKAITLNDGSVAAFCLIGTTKSLLACEPWEEPVVVISRDGCKTWEDPIPVSEFKGRIYDVLYQDGIVYVLELCNPADVTFISNKPEHVYRLFRSVDNCKTFEEVSVLPFGLGHGYGNLIFTPNGDLIAFAYQNDDEYHMSYAISSNLGKTWKETGVSFLANRIRNPQVGVLDGQYILHGRAGENERGNAGQFVFYTSADAIHWDEGTVLVKGRRACFYSCNLTIRLPDGRERMIVKYSENYADPTEDWSGRVNSMMLFVETCKE